MNLFKYAFLKFAVLFLIVIIMSANVFSQVNDVNKTNDDIKVNEVNEAKYLKALQLINEKRFSDAKIILIQVIENEPKHAGAWLDLAIVQCELGNKDEATRLFNQMAIKFNPPQPILEVIAKQKNRHCSENAWVNQFSINIERGYDSNVNQGANNATFTLGSGTSQIELQLLPEYLPKSDQFSAISFNTAIGKASEGISAFAHANLRQYDQYSAFNTAFIAAGLEKIWHTDQLETYTSINMTRLALNNHLYQQQTGLNLNLTPALPLSEKVQISFIGGITFVKYPSLVNYDSTIYDFKSRVFYMAENFQLQSNLGYSLDKASLTHLGGDRKGRSFNLTLKNKLFSDWESEISWGRQLWNSESAYSPGLIDQARKQDTELIKFALIFPFKKYQTLRLELRSLKNQENISILEYKNKSILLNWTWQK